MSARKASAILWFDGDAQAAAHFYTARFPHTEVTGTILSPDGDTVLLADMALLCMPYTLMNGGPRRAPMPPC